jgi:hypothetical protein
MEKMKINPRIGILCMIVLMAAMTRLLPHPPNVTAVGAMALFGGCYFDRKWQAMILPLAALWLSDLVLNNIVYKAYNPIFTLFNTHSVWSYTSVALTAVFGAFLLKKVKINNVVVASVLASTVFYLITNFGAWFVDSFNIYSDSLDGLAASYVAGLPFFINSLFGDLVWCGVLFGSYEWAKRQYPVLAA